MYHFYRGNGKWEFENACGSFGDESVKRGAMSAAGFLSLLFLRTVFAIAVEFQLVVDHVESAIFLDLVLHIGKKSFMGKFDHFPAAKTDEMVMGMIQ